MINRFKTHFASGLTAEKYLQLNGLITAAAILYSFAGVWAMAYILLAHRGKTLVKAIDNTIQEKL